MFLEYFRWSYSRTCCSTFLGILLNWRYSWG